MNFLAHLHIAHVSNSSLMGNLLGDFVKGDPDKQYSHIVSQGIRLHRFVDSYTDSHSVMREAKSYFSPETRRFAGIALDVMWDHYLATNWKLYHDRPLNDFCRFAEREVKLEQHQSATISELPNRYLQMTTRMWQGQWLQSYQTLENIEFALQRMSLRSPRMAPLAECFAPLSAHYAELESLFVDFYPELLQVSRDFTFSSGK
ncbi:ACP phosphodiesterase [Vibrio ponticus]|uniref:ACP phosphodiesterase n=1 Tax=Vibrio ponticus TaxID=265668 RepID=A0ABX3F8C9_9VIBR|nr:ACP phosphodiesterase [Vibrio ponticus]OLQ84971.1 ACP phosphodiesterase [Vibrio ponticus]